MIFNLYMQRVIIILDRAGLSRLNKYVHAENIRVIKFLLIGGTSFFVQFLFFNLYILMFNINPTIAVFLADFSAVITSFFLNNYFTFGDRKHSINMRLLRKFGKYYAVVFVATAIQAIVMYLGSNFVNDNYYMLQLYLVIGVGLAAVWNFTLHSRVVWPK
jgi:putative flippase GtrA